MWIISRTGPVEPFLQEPWFLLLSAHWNVGSSSDLGYRLLEMAETPFLFKSVVMAAAAGQGDYTGLQSLWAGATTAPAAPPSAPEQQAEVMAAEARGAVASQWMAGS